MNARRGTRSIIIYTFFFLFFRLNCQRREIISEILSGGPINNEVTRRNDIAVKYSSRLRNEFVSRDDPCWISAVVPAIGYLFVRFLNSESNRNAFFY